MLLTEICERMQNGFLFYKNIPKFFWRIWIGICRLWFSVRMTYISIKILWSTYMKYFIVFFYNLFNGTSHSSFPWPTASNGTITESWTLKYVAASDFGTIWSIVSRVSSSDCGKPLKLMILHWVISVQSFDTITLHRNFGHLSTQCFRKTDTLILPLRKPKISYT
jgi:hypothetical protein